MKIRRAQMDALAAAQEAAYIRGIRENLEREIPQFLTGLTPELIEHRITIALDRARDFGIPDDDSKARVLWVRLMFSVGPDFDRQPAVQPILGDTLAPPEMRVLSLLSIRNHIPWDEVRRGCRPEAWEH